MSGELFELEARSVAGGPVDVLLRLHVQPGAGRAAVMGRHGDALKVKVAAPPLQGRANTAVCELVGELFGVPVSRVELVSGQTHRDKRIRIREVDPAHVARVIDQEIERAGSSVGGRDLHGRGQR